MLATLIPLFDNSSEVRAYSLFAQKENKLLTPLTMSTSAFDGALSIPGMDIIENVGLENLSGDRDLFIEINQVSILSDVESQCKVDPRNVVFLLDPKIEPNDTYANRIESLKAKGFRFAAQKFEVQHFSTHNVILSLMDYILINHKKINVESARDILLKAYPNIKLVAVSVDTKDEYDSLSKAGRFDLYEGEFFRMPVKHAGEELSPMKITYIELLKVINVSDFDLTAAADVIGHDTALVLNLLEMANKMSSAGEITSIRHAAAMIGQKELKKWINSVVTKELCADRPSEIMRISLIRARFAENLAPLFDLAMLDQECFLAGLFSVLDIILDKPISEALDMISVSKDIRDALVDHTGKIAPVVDFLVQYENAGWQEVSRVSITQNIGTDEVYEAYVDALKWFKNLFA